MNIFSKVIIKYYIFYMLLILLSSSRYKYLLFLVKDKEKTIGVENQKQLATFGILFICF